MKCVWIVNHYAQSGYGVGGSRHYSLAKGLIDHGWQSCIFAASVELNTQQQRLARGKKIRTDTDEGIIFRWIATPQYRGNGPGRMFNMLVFSLRLLLPWYRTELPKPDVIIGSTVHPFAALSAAVLARWYRVPFIFEIRDLWPLTLIAFGRLRAGSMTARILAMIEIWLCRQASRIVSVLPRFDDYAESIGISKNKFVWIPNGADIGMLGSVAPYTKHEKFILMYLGAHGNANSLDTLLDAMKLLAARPGRENIVCRMIGDGSLKEQLKARAHEQMLKNVVFEDPVPKSEIPALGAQADVFILCARDLPDLYRYGISMNKLYDYMAMARPTVTALNAVNNPVAESKGGLTVAPEEPAALAQAIEQLADMPENGLSAMGQRARAYVQQYNDFRVLAGKLARTLDEVVSN